MTTLLLILKGIVETYMSSRGLICFANPQGQDVHVDSALTNVSVKYQNADLVGDKIFPVISVKKDSDLYFKYGKQDFRIYDDLRAPGARAKRFEWKIEKSLPYALREHSLEEQLVDETRDNCDDPIKYDADSTELVTNALMLRVESDVAVMANDISNYASGHYQTPTLAWDRANSIPLDDIDNAKEIVRQKIFRKPNTLVVSEATHKVLRKHPQLLDLFKYTKGGTLQVDQLKSAFEVQNYVVYGAGVLTSAEGQSETFGQLWGKNAALLYVSPTPGLKQISFAYIFRKTGYRLVERWREDSTRSDWIRVSDKYEINLISNVAGDLITGAIS